MRGLLVVVSLAACGTALDNSAIDGPPACGNNLVETGETCDDGNDVDGDGCDTNCTPSDCDNGIAAPGEVCYGQPRPVTAGMLPRAVRLGDVDGDGDLDAVVANNTSGTVSVFVNGGGLFSLVAETPAGLGTNCIALGDFDGDGLLDVAAVNITDNTVGILRNTGGGMLAPPVAIAVGMGPFSIAVGDVDGDGDLDLVTANFVASTISVLTNTNGTFVAVDVTAPTNPHAVAIADLDGDGDREVIIAAHGIDALAVFDNTGGGALAGPVTFTVGDGPEDSIVIGDLDGDGRIDLGSTNTFTNDLSVLAGNGTSTGFAAQRLIAVGAGSFPQTLAAGDVDGDGDLDLVVGMRDLDQIALLLNDGAGGFGAPQVLGPAANPESVVLGDVNGDGRLDILSANAGTNQIGVILSAP